MIKEILQKLQRNKREKNITFIVVLHSTINTQHKYSIVTEGVQFRIGDEYEGSGRAEIYLNGRWGTICNVYWDDADAEVFCRQLGDYVGGVQANPTTVGSSEQDIWMTRVECVGNETDFLQCEASWYPAQTQRCTHGNDAGVVCFKSGG
jgi:hypothetical protein